MATVSARLRRQVERLDRERCAYCQTLRIVSGAQMHIEHIHPLSKEGTTTVGNLCLACAWCNSYKGAQTHATDPVTGEIAPLFHPRLQTWSQHFQWDEEGVRIQGITPVGRATVAALQMNNEFIIPSRRLWRTAGWHPPADGDQ